MMWFVWLLVNTALIVGMFYALFLIYQKLREMGHLDTKISSVRKFQPGRLPFQTAQQFQRSKTEATERWERHPEYGQMSYCVNYIIGQLLDSTSEMTPKVTRKVARGYAYLSRVGLLRELPIEPPPRRMHAQMNLHLGYQPFRDLFLKRTAAVLSREIHTDPDSPEVAKTLQTIQEALKTLPSFRNMAWMKEPPQRLAAELFQLRELDVIQDRLFERNITRNFRGKKQVG